MYCGKADKLLFIKKKNADLSALNDIQIGTEEVIGKLGNDTLYRKTYTYEGSAIAATTVIDSSLTTATIKPFKIVGSGFRKDSTVWHPMGILGNYYLITNIGSNGARVETNMNITKYVVSIEYTKL